MADQAVDKVDATAPAVEAPSASGDNVGTEPTEATPKVDTKPDDGDAGKEDKVTEETKTDEPAPKADDAPAPAESAEQVEDKPVDADTEMKEAASVPEGQEASTLDATADTTIDATADTTTTETPSAKNKNRRKSAGGESKGKTLSKKASKAKITHSNAQPGDHFLVKLKGFPAWPAIVCDEDMLPEALLTTRPVTAARKDGTYNDNYADGGKRVNDRTFPVMYLHTWEFGWVNNNNFTELSPEKAKSSINEKMRKDLKAAFELAAEGHPVEHYKDMLREFQEDAIKRQEEEIAAAAAAAATPKKSKKAKVADDEDVDMADVGESAKAKSKKRKADEETSTPQRSDSVKKPKIKLNTSSTPKTANGASAPKKEDSAVKAAKPKKQKSKDSVEKKDSQEAKEAKATPEERHARKEKEVMYLRHKLQRGLLTRDQQPQESEMQQMSEYVTILEKLKDLEVSIIRATKINKVLKAILKLDSIPKEEEYKFKPRSQALLDKWNKLMGDDSGPPNGVNGSAENKQKPEANGAKTAAPEASKPEAAPVAEVKKEQAAAPEAEAKPEETKAPEEPVKAEATTTTSEAVEATA